MLPAATWGEKLGTFTNADRTVHLSERPSTRPAKPAPDLDIFLDYARRMDFRDRDGEPLITWNDAESAFEAWKACSRGRPCDYTGITYDRLRGGSGIQWPCTAGAPDGTERLYADGVFNTDPDYCETYGHDLATGAAHSETEYRAKQPAAERSCTPSTTSRRPRSPTTEYPLLLTTGRTVYHFHTRTKTGRAPQLDRPPRPTSGWSSRPRDADDLGVGEGDLVEVALARAAPCAARARDLRHPRRASCSCPSTTATGTPDADGPASPSRPRTS